MKKGKIIQRGWTAPFAPTGLGAIASREKRNNTIEQGVAPLRATSGARVNADVGSKKMKKIFIPIIVGAAVGGMIAIIGPSIVLGCLPYTEVVFLSAIFIGIPITLASLILLLFPRFRATILPGFGLGAMFGLLMSLLGASHADQLKRVHNRIAKQYCETLIPRLDDYFAKHGDYPNAISDITPEEAPPYSVYLKTQYYWKGTNGYSFSWADSPGFPLCSGVTCYGSQSKLWDSCADWGSWTE